MEAFRFETRISQKGKIDLPIDPDLYGKEVEIIIFPKDSTKNSKASSAEFVEKWTGFISFVNEDSKYEYLANKHK